MVLTVNAKAVIGDRKLNPVALIFNCDGDSPLRTVVVFNRVADQVGEHLLKQDLLGMDCERRAALLNGERGRDKQIIEDILNKRAGF